MLTESRRPARSRTAAASTPLAWATKSPPDRLSRCRRRATRVRLFRPAAEFAISEAALLVTRNHRLCFRVSRDYEREVLSNCLSNERRSRSAGGVRLARFHRELPLNA